MGLRPCIGPSFLPTRTQTDEIRPCFGVSLILPRHQWQGLGHASPALAQLVLFLESGLQGETATGVSHYNEASNGSFEELSTTFIRRGSQRLIILDQFCISEYKRSDSSKHESVEYELMFSGWSQVQPIIGFKFKLTKKRKYSLLEMGVTDLGTFMSVHYASTLTKIF